VPYRAPQADFLFGVGGPNATIEGGPHDWGPFNDYDRLTIAAGATVNAPTTDKGPLIVRARSVLEIAGQINAKGVGRTGSYYSGGTGSWEYGTRASFGPVDLNGGADTVYESWIHAVPIPGGGGGDGTAANGYSCHLYAAKSSGALVYGGVFTSSYVAGGTDASKNGKDGDTVIVGGVDLADCIVPELGLFAVGCGGGAGGRDDQVYTAAAGGNAGGLVILIAPRVVLRATAAIDVRGDDGTAASQSGGGGGGGAGGGCLTILCHRFEDEGVTVLKAGGMGGAGNGTGGNGGAGSDGILVVREVL